MTTQADNNPPAGKRVHAFLFNHEVGEPRAYLGHLTRAELDAVRLSTLAEGDGTVLVTTLREAAAMLLQTQYLMTVTEAVAYAVTVESDFLERIADGDLSTEHFVDLLRRSVGDAHDLCAIEAENVALGTSALDAEGRLRELLSVEIESRLPAFLAGEGFVWPLGRESSLAEFVAALSVSALFPAGDKE